MERDVAEQEKLNLLRLEGKLVTREVYGSRTLFEGLDEEEEEDDGEQEEEEEEYGEQEEGDDDERKEEGAYTGSPSKCPIPPSPSGSNASGHGRPMQENDLSPQPTQSDSQLFAEGSTKGGVSVPVVPDADKLATLLSWGCEVSE